MVVDMKVKKYFFFDTADENREVLKKYNVWHGIKNEINTRNGCIENEYEKDYIKIKFNSDDDLPLNKPLKFYNIAVTVRSVFEEDVELYLQVFLDNTYIKMLEYKRIDIS